MRARLLVLAGVLVLVLLGSVVLMRQDTKPVPNTMSAPSVLLEPQTAASQPEEIQAASFEIASSRVYEFSATAIGTVESLMQDQRNTGTLVYESSQHPMLGSFIESINGRKNGDGAFWMLYINGTLSSRGMSSATVVPGDRIEWRHE